MNETKWGECRICKQKQILQSVIGSLRGQVWAGWVCCRCLEELQKKDGGQK